MASPARAAPGHAPGALHVECGGGHYSDSSSGREADGLQRLFDLLAGQVVAVKSDGDALRVGVSRLEDGARLLDDRSHRAQATIAVDGGDVQREGLLCHESLLLDRKPSSRVEGQEGAGDSSLAAAGAWMQRCAYPHDLPSGVRRASAGAAPPRSRRRACAARRSAPSRHVGSVRRPLQLAAHAHEGGGAHRQPGALDEIAVDEHVHHAELVLQQQEDDPFRRQRPLTADHQPRDLHCRPARQRAQVPRGVHALAQLPAQELHRVAIRREREQLVVRRHALIIAEVRERHLVLLRRQREAQLPSPIRRGERGLLHPAAEEAELPQQLAAVEPEGVEGAHLDQVRGRSRESPVRCTKSNSERNSSPEGPCARARSTAAPPALPTPRT